MALILSIETATTMCSVALSSGGIIISIKEEDGGYSHAEKLTVFIQEMMKESGKKLSDIDVVALSKGPGSYTGLRIGTSVAKGLCYALEKPLIAVSTLKGMAAGALQSSMFKVQRGEEGKILLCPMIDARRMEVYCALFDATLNNVMPVQSKIIDNNSFSDFFQSQNIFFFGDGAPKLKGVFENQSNASFLNILPSAKGIAILAEQKFERNDFEDLALFEPFYLKEPAVKIPKS